MYQIKHHFDLSNCKFTHSFLISAIWRGSPCRRSNDDANTDSTAQVRAAELKWQTVLPAIWSQRRRDVGCATATLATDANVVTMSPDVALLAGESVNGDFPCAKLENAKKIRQNFFLATMQKTQNLYWLPC